MHTYHQNFLRDSEKKAFDLKHRKTIQFNMGRYDMAVAKGKNQYINLDLARRQAAMKKYKAIEHLEETLKDFEGNFTKKGGKVIWAQDAREACEAVLGILQKNQVRLVVKSKSMITEEIELNGFLEAQGIETVETDLGEYIVQISDDKPYHIVTPVMHKSAADIGQIFHEKFGLDPQSTPEAITAFVREKLRRKFEQAGAGISGANFLVANPGAVALTENEGNGVMSVSLPDIHIAIAGIEKVIANMDDLALFWPLLATHGTGQQLTVYNSLISGPRQKNEANGPSQMYVILVDNGRSKLLAQIPQRRALSCIRCGACLNACPIYRNVGGHTYGAVYSGPIGAVINPHLRSMAHFKHLSYASSLCGKCTEVCPVNIDLHEQLLQNRNAAVRQGLAASMETYGIRAWKIAMTHRWMLDVFPGRVKNFFLKKVFRKAWGPRRELPVMAPKSFGQLWKERQSGKA